MKRILCLLTIATLCVAGRSYVMADEIDDKNLLNGGYYYTTKCRGRIRIWG